MGDLRVRLSLRDEVVEDRVLVVSDRVRLGEALDAKVSFPGADVQVRRVGDDFRIRGRWLREGETLDLSLGAVHVVFEHTRPAGIPGAWRSALDLRFALSAVAVVVLAAWIDTAKSVVNHRADDGVIAQQLSWWMGTDAADPDSRVSSVSAAPDELTGPTIVLPVDGRVDGPRAQSNDAQTGFGYKDWYRRQVSVERSVVEATRRLAEGSSAHAARQAYAAASYATDDYERAAQVYRELLDVRGASVEVLWGLAMSERRLGRHRVELALYQALLNTEPENPRFLGALATAAARFSRFHEAHALLNRSRSAESIPRALDVSAAVVYALEGDDRKAIRFIERVLEHTDELDAEERVEFARDLALDPAFARLRGDRRLRNLLARQLGAAAPLPIW